MEPSQRVFEQAEGDAFASVVQGRRLLGLDLGTKTLGLAICDERWSLATPVRTIQRTKFTADVEAMLAYAAAEKVGGLVLGLPFNMDGSEGPRAQSTRAFARNLERLTPLPVLFWDERLSSHEADGRMERLGVAKRNRRTAIDAAAAAVILDDCLRAIRP
ncbi:Holliday junction resolvase RuvX [Rhizobiaceae bacterium]|nr:Holliday junction resolvase RuvX [Rhizobiaceae bacterium]